ncbi:MAG: hypothetical protein PF545_00145, partial [Elusimicrobia bacterium]|nr:hypothetical protein [Elusimicrobiota bacterium]
GTGEDTSPGIWTALTLRIKNKDTTNYWSGSGWVPDSNNWQSATVYTSSWTYSGVNWVSGYEYLVEAYATDKAGNSESVNSYTFLYDNEIPASLVSQPADGSYKNSMANVTGNAEDTTSNIRISTVNVVEVAYKGLTAPNTGYYAGASPWVSKTPQWYNASYSPVTLAWQADVNPFVGKDNPEDGNYMVIPKAQDYAGNTEVAYDTATFTWDLTKPTFTVISPSTGAIIRTLSVNYRNSEELNAGKLVFTAETSSNTEVAGSTDTWHSMTSGEKNQGEHTTTSFNDPLTDGNRYTLQPAGDDLAGNSDNGSYIYTGILYDATPPVSYVTYPDKSFHSDVSQISGTSSDPEPGSGGITSGISSVKITIKSTTTGKYWDGSAWSGTEEFLTATLSVANTFWYYDMAVDTFTNGREYEITSKSFDNAGSTQTTPDMISFIYDESLPSVSVTNPSAEQHYRSITSFAGNADDDKELDYVEIRISSGSTYWDGSGWTGSETWLTTDNNTWAYSSGPSAGDLGTGATYKVRARAYDTAGNEQLSAEITFYGDVTDPVTKSVIPAGEAAYSYDFYNLSYLINNNLSGTASDSGAGIDKVEFTLQNENISGNYYDGSDFNSGSLVWISASGTTDWYKIISTDVWDNGGKYELIARAEDAALTESGSTGNYDLILSTAHLQCDFDAPMTSVIYPSDSSALNEKPTENDGNTAISGDAEDFPAVNSGLAQVKIALRRGDGDYWTGVGWGVLGPSSWKDVTPDPGLDAWKKNFDPAAFPIEDTYRIYTKAKDNASSEEAVSLKATFKYDVTAPTSTVTYPVDNDYYTTGDGVDTKVYGGYDMGDFSGVTLVEIKISSGSYYWTGSSWTTTNMYSNTPATLYTSSWTYDTSAITLNDAVSYSVTSKVTDDASNIETAPVPVSFTYDTTKPDTTVSVPQNNLTYEYMNTVSGTAGDAVSGITTAGGGQVDVLIKRNFGNYWSWDFSGSTWTLADSWETATLSAGDWSLDSSTIPWADDKNYKVQTRGTDNVGILETSLPSAIFKYVKPATHLTIIDMPTSVTAGDSNVITVRALNEDSNIATAYSSTVTFTSDDGKSDFPVNYHYTTTDAGEHVFAGEPVILRTAGSFYIQVSDNENGDITPDSINVDVDWGGVSKFVIDPITISDPSTAGVLQSPKVTAYDEIFAPNGNIVKDYDGDVEFLSTDGTMSKGNGLPSNYTFTTDEDGVHTFNSGGGELFMKSTGTYNITVRDVSTPTITGQITGIDVNPGALSGFRVTGLPDPYTAGTSTSINVEAEDQFSNRKTDYAGTIQFITGDGHASSELPSNYIFTTIGGAADDGLHQFNGTTSTNTVTLVTAGPQYVRVEDTISLKKGTQTVTVEAAVSDHFEVTMTTNVTAGVSKDVTVKAVDTYGNLQTGYDGELVSFTSDNSNYTTDGNGTVNSGEETFTTWITLKAAVASCYLKAADADSSPNIEGQQSGIKVTADNATQLTISNMSSEVDAGAANVITINAKDQYNNIDVSFNSTVTFHTGGTDTSATVDGFVVPSTKTITSGAVVANVKFITAGTGRELWVYAAGVSSASKTNIKVNPATADSFQVVLPDLTGGAVTDDKAMDMVVTALDQYGNTAKNYYSTVTFSCDADNFSLPSDYIFNSTTDQGVHTFTGGITIYSTNTGAGWSVNAEDFNNAAINGSKTGVKVLLPPSSTITMPLSNSRYYQLPIASGTVLPHDSSYATVTDVRMSLKCDDTVGPAGRVTQYWRGGVSWGAEKWLATPFTASAGTWTRVQGSGDLPTWTVNADGNAKYYFKIKSYDTLYGTETTKGPFMFIIDTGKPDTLIETPADGNNYASINTIDGTASDPGGSDISSVITKVEIQISYLDVATTYYYDAAGSTFTSSKWINAVASDGNYDLESENWYWDSSGISWKSNQDYTIKSRTYDNTGNAEITYDEITVTYDTGVPDSDIDSPADGAVSDSLSQIGGTAEDTQGIGYVKVRIRRGAGEYWDGSGWVAETWLSGASGSWGNSSVNWTFSIPGSPFTQDTTYYFTSRSTDTAGNTETALTEREFIYDTTNPTTTVTNISNGDDKNWTFTDITGTSYDLHQVTNVQVSLRRDPDVWWNGSGWDSAFANMQWVDAATSDGYLNWTVSGINWEDGRNHQIWVRVYDEAGNKTAYKSDTDSDIELNQNYLLQFQYDESTPTANVEYPVNTSSYNTKIQTFTGTATDYPTPNSGVSIVKLKITRDNGDYWDGSIWGGEISRFADYPAGPDDWQYGINTGDLNTFYENNEETYYIKTYAKDNAGNESTYILDTTYYYDVVKPTSSIDYPVDGQYYTAGDGVDTEISGGHYDGFTGIDFVKVKVSSGAYYWSGSSWTTTDMYSNTDATVHSSSWTYSAPDLPSWDDAAVYNITTFVKDKAGMVQNSTPTVSFTYDTTEPVSFMAIPQDGLMYEAMDIVKSSATDALSGVSTIDISIQRLTDNWYWNAVNSTWTVSVVYNTTTINSGFYELDTSTIEWVNNVNYRVTSKASDNVGIAETGLADESRADFTFVKPAVEFSLEDSGGSDLEGYNTTAGQQFDVRVRALNEDGTPALAFNKTVTFTTSDTSGEYTLPGNYKFDVSDSGVKDFDFATSTGIILKDSDPQTQWVKVECVEGAPPASDTDNLTVKWDKADHFKVTNIPAGVTAGDKISPTVTVYDGIWGSDGNVVKDYRYDVDFLSDDTQATLPTYTFTSSTDQGVHTFNAGGGELVLKTTTESGWYVRGRDVSTTSIYGEVTGITVGPAGLDHFAVSGLPDPYTAGISTGLIVEAQDVYNNTKTDYSGTVTATSADTGALLELPASYTFTTIGAGADGGIHQFKGATSTDTVHLVTVGSQYVRYYDSSFSDKRGKQTVTVEPATRDHYIVSMSTNINAGNYNSITVTAKDLFNNTDTNNTDAIQFQTDNPAYDLPAVGAQLVSGQKTWTGASAVMLNKSSWTPTGQLTDPWKVSAAWTGNPGLINGTATGILVNPKPADNFKVSGIPSPFNPPDHGGSNGFYVTAQDEYDNRDVNYSSTITFTSNNGNWTVS